MYPMGQRASTSLGTPLDRGVGTKSYEVTIIGGGEETDPQWRSEHVSEESHGRKVQMLGHHTIGERLGDPGYEIQSEEVDLAVHQSLSGIEGAKSRESIAGMARSQERRGSDIGCNASERNNLNETETGQHTGGHSGDTGPSFTSKLKGKAEKAAGKVTGNDAMIQRGEERQSGSL